MDYSHVDLTGKRPLHGLSPAAANQDGLLVVDIVLYSFDFEATEGGCLCCHRSALSRTRRKTEH